MHKHLLYIALAHLIVVVFGVHWPMDHVCIGVAYGLAWSHALMPNEYDRFLKWLLQETVVQMCARLGLLLLRLRFRMTLSVKGIQVRVKFRAWVAPPVAAE